MAGEEWVVLVNPAAGRRAIDPARVTSALDRAGVPGRVELVTGADEMAGAVVDVGRRGRPLAVVGGDGTVNLAVNALFAAGIDVPSLGILPSGTGCDLLRTFGIPQDIEAAAAHLRGDATYRIDVGILEGGWGIRRFVNVAQAGAGAAAAETAPRLPRWMGGTRYPLAFAARLPRFPGCEVRLADGWEHSGPALAVIIANAQFFAKGWNVAPRAMLVDGELDVQVISARKRDAPALVPKIVRGVHLSDRSVRRRSVASLRLESDVPWPVECDGDLLGTTPLRASVLAGALTLKI